MLVNTSRRSARSIRAPVIHTPAMAPAPTIIRAAWVESPTSANLRYVAM